MRSAELHAEQHVLSRINKTQIGDTKSKREYQSRAEIQQAKRRPFEVITLAVAPDKAQSQSQKRRHQRQIFEVRKDANFRRQPTDNQQLAKKREDAYKKKLSSRHFVSDPFPAALHNYCPSDWQN